MVGIKTYFRPTNGTLVNFQNILSDVLASLAPTFRRVVAGVSVSAGSLALAGVLFAWPVNPDASYSPAQEANEAERFVSVLMAQEAIETEPRLHPLQQLNDKFVQTSLLQHNQTLLENLAASTAEHEKKHTLSDGLIWLTMTVRRGDSMSRMFNRHQLDRHDLHEILELERTAKYVRRLQPGQIIRIKHDTAGKINTMVITSDKQEEIHVTRTEEGYTSGLEKHLLKSEIQATSVKMGISLVSSAKKAGLSSGLISQLTRIFDRHIDFAKGVKPNDHFSIVYEAFHYKDEPVEFGAILAAEFVNAGQSYRAIRYTDPEGYTGYYTPMGKNLQRTFLQKPVETGRLSSRFSRGRSHPVLKNIRAHRGVDYRAPRGSKVIATSGGVVKFVGRQRGYGKVVELQHGDQY
ncbi:MAG: peptidoglycan DD-metalloendopeptidase family protein, partial [Pseudomonadota bacterium]